MTKPTISNSFCLDIIRPPSGSLPHFMCELSVFCIYFNLGLCAVHYLSSLRNGYRPLFRILGRRYLQPLRVVMGNHPFFQKLVVGHFNFQWNHLTLNGDACFPNESSNLQEDHSSWKAIPTSH